MFVANYILLMSLMICDAQVMYDLFYTQTGGRKSIFKQECSFPCNDLGSTMVTFDIMINENATCPDLSDANLKKVSVGKYDATYSPCKQETRACSYCLNKRKKSMILKKSCKVGLSKMCSHSPILEDARCYDCQLFNHENGVESDF